MPPKWALAISNSSAITAPRYIRFPEANLGSIVGYEYTQRHRPFVFEDDWDFRIEFPLAGRASLCCFQPDGNLRITGPISRNSSPSPPPTINTSGKCTTFPRSKSNRTCLHSTPSPVIWTSNISRATRISAPKPPAPGTTSASGIQRPHGRQPRSFARAPAESHELDRRHHRSARSR